MPLKATHAVGVAEERSPHNQESLDLSQLGQSVLKNSSILDKIAKSEEDKVDEDGKSGNDQNDDNNGNDEERKDNHNNEVPEKNQQQINQKM